MIEDLPGFMRIRDALGKATMHHLSINQSAKHFDDENRQLRDIWAQCNTAEREHVIILYVEQILEG